jgi:hypothetical protein
MLGNAEGDDQKLRGDLCLIYSLIFMAIGTKWLCAVVPDCDGVCPMRTLEMQNPGDITHEETKRTGLMRRCWRAGYLKALE